MSNQANLVKRFLNIAKDLKLFYVNQLSPNRHTLEDPVHDTSDILDMAFLPPGLSSRDISFSVVDDHMGSHHFFMQISFDKPLKRDTPLTEPRYRLDKTDDDLLHNTPNSRNLQSPYVTNS